MSLISVYSNIGDSLLALMVSVSGVRGIVGKDLTPPVIVAYTVSFARLLNKQKKKVLIGRDTRESGRVIGRIVEGTLASLGFHTINAGITTTPGVLLATRNLQCAGGVAITASHNPFPWNALKFCNEKGLFLGAEEIDLIDMYARKTAADQSMWSSFDAIGCMSSDHSINVLHANEVIKHLDAALIMGKKFRVAVDPGGGAGSFIDRVFLEKIGCEVFSIHGVPEGSTVQKEFPRGTEPVPENLEGLCGLVRDKGADIGFAQDPDGDRLSVVSESGTAIGEEYTIVLAGDAFLSRKKTDIACNLSSSLMVDDLAQRHGVNVHRTKIGEIHVTQALMKTGSLFGGEGNGGVIVPEINPCRDSLVAMGLILELLARTGKSVSQLVQSIPHYVLKKEKVAFSVGDVDNYLEQICDRAKNIFHNYSINILDGIKIYTISEWLHLRPSNTEPVMRIFAESSNEKRTSELIEMGKSLI